MRSSTRPDRRLLLKAGAAAIAGAALPLPLWCARAALPLALLTFPGSYNLLIWAAEEQGFFAKEGLEISRRPAATSMHLIESVNSGAFPIGASSIDNVVAYNKGQGAVELDRPVRLFSFMSIQPRMVFPLVAAPGIESVAELEGKSLAVDAVSTGFSFVLREILRVHGLGAEAYELVSVGNARERLEAMKAGRYAAALLTPPFDARAEAAGLRIIATSDDAFGEYQGTTFIASRYWAETRREELIAFTKAMLRSFAFLRDPANATAAADILSRRMAGFGPENAAAAVADLRDTLSPDFNMAGIETVLALRSRYGRPQRELGDPGAYIDTSYLEAARTALGLPD